MGDSNRSDKVATAFRLLLLLSLVADPIQGSAETLAVAPFKTVGVELSISEALRWALADELDRWSPYPIVSRAELEERQAHAMGGQLGQRHDCYTLQCLSAIGKNLDVAWLIGGVIRRRSQKEAQLKLALIDVDREQVLQKIELVLKDPLHWGQQTRAVGEKLFQVSGSLVVVSNVRGAMVSIDGQRFGKTPLALAEIRVGRRMVEVAKGGHFPYVGVVTVERDQVASLRAFLPKR